MRLNQTYTLHAPVAKVWQALTDATVIEHWTIGEARMEALAGGAFSLNEGDIYGTNVKVAPQKLLQQDWHMAGTPERVYDVTFTLEAVAGATAMSIAHDVSGPDRQIMEEYWHQNYFAQLKQLLEGQASQRVRLQLTEKQQVSDNAWSFRFTPTQRLTWLAGQHIWVELLHDRPDAGGARRWFTISSAPYEQIVQITTRITGSSFKQALQALPIGGELELLEKPDGDFVWQDSPLPLVFVAGGIGITAFHSMLKQRFYDKQPMAVTLIYGNRTADIPFKDELEHWAASDSRCKVHYVTGMPLTSQRLAEIEPQLNKSLVYVSGPEPMVQALGDELIRHGLPQSQLRLDALTHYDQRNY